MPMRERCVSCGGFGAWRSLASALDWGSRGRRFKSCRPDFFGPASAGRIHMPELSRFYGLRITMNYADHVPPHFHATYGDEEAQIEISSGDIVGGSLPRRAVALVKEWAELHRSELEDNWRRREQSLPLNKIDPLP